MPLPSSPGITVSVDYFTPLPLTPRGNLYVLIFTDRFSRRANMFAVTAAQFTASGTADILIDRHITLWGYPETLISDNGQQVDSKLSNAVYDCFSINKINTSTYHLSTSGGVEYVNHVLAQMLSMVKNDRKPTGMYICHTSCRPATTSSRRYRTSPNEIHVGRLPRIPLSVFQPPSFGGHRSLKRDSLAYINLATDYQ